MVRHGEWAASMTRAPPQYPNIRLPWHGGDPSLERCSEAQVSIQMPTETNALIRTPRKREEILKSPNGLSDVSILNLAVDSESLFRRGFFRPRVPKEESSDEVFQALLLEANRELARLLQDVRSGSHAALLSGDQSRATSQLLMRAVRCATKQYMLQAELGNLALTDELTGLYNRRGFMVLAERQLKLARRSGRGMLLFFIDVNGLKQINDSFGHSEGDRSLKSTAQALEKTFRDSDVIARLGGDEFAALAIEASGHSEDTIRARLSEYLGTISAKESRCAISLSVGWARFDPRSRASIGELLVQADQAMYEQKRRRTESRSAVATGCQS